MYLFTWVSVSVFGLLNALLREITNVKSEQFVPHKEWGQILNKSLGHLHLCIQIKFQWLLFLVAQKTIQIRNLKEHCQKNKKVKKYTCIYPTGKNIKSKKIECARKTKITWSGMVFNIRLASLTRHLSLISVAKLPCSFLGQSFSSQNLLKTSVYQLFVFCG